MKRQFWFQFAFFIVVVVISALAVFPTLFPKKDITRMPFKSKINLGLDLQGGLYMILGIDFNKTYKDEVGVYLHKVQFFLKDLGIETDLGALDITDPADPKQWLMIKNPSDLEKVKKELKDKNYLSRMRVAIEKEGEGILFGLSRVAREEIEQSALSKSIEVIRNRIDEFGVAEPEIISQGKDRIVVQLPGVKDIERAKNLIGKTAKLEFKIVNDEVNPATLEQWVVKAKAQGIEYKQNERYSTYLSRINEFLAADLPKGYELAFSKDTNALGEVLRLQPYLIEQATRLSGEDLEDASVGLDPQSNAPNVSMSFKASGTKTFKDITTDNVGKRLAIVLDGTVYTAPSIREPIGGGHAQISLGSGSHQEVLKEAHDIALVLRAGALPVQLEFEEQRIVGPSLGNDSVESAKWASLIGCMCVFVFILLRYKVSGFIAAITLGVNVLIILAVLVGIKATLTLPGIAGIALTVGMAVDGNIIIYERIREDLHLGIPFQQALEVGFAKTLWTILDANITTALAGLCLLNFGTGPIRGFAVTLLIGIVSTVYTCYYVSRLLMELASGGYKKTVSI